MEKAIIHISDLHVTTYKRNDGTIEAKINSYLSTNEDTAISDHFINIFLTEIRKAFPDHFFLLIVTGDISHQGEINEFNYAIKFIKRIINELQIRVEDCIIVPGDHDVHRRSLENHLDLSP